jgi:hypothetical protein
MTTGERLTVDQVKALWTLNELKSVRTRQPIGIVGSLRFSRN